MTNKNFGDLDNVTFLYARIAEPYKGKFSEVAEYQVTVVVSPQQFKEFTSVYKNKAKMPVPTADFKEKYKIDPPFPDDMYQHILTFKQKAFKRDGTPMAESTRPRAFRLVGDKAIDITSTLIGNGSKGVLRYSIRPYEFGGQSGTALDLKSVLITDLVEYKKEDPNDFSSYT